MAWSTIISQNVVEYPITSIHELTEIVESRKEPTKSLDQDVIPIPEVKSLDDAASEDTIHTFIGHEKQLTEKSRGKPRKEKIKKQNADLDEKPAEPVGGTIKSDETSAEVSLSSSAIVSQEQEEDVVRPVITETVRETANDAAIAIEEKEQSPESVALIETEVTIPKEEEVNELPETARPKERKEKPKKQKQKKEKSNVVEEEPQVTQTTKEHVSEPSPEPDTIIHEEKVAPTAPPSVWSRSETYAEVVRKSGLVDNTNIRYQELESEPTTARIFAPEVEASMPYESEFPASTKELVKFEQMQSEPIVETHPVQLAPTMEASTAEAVNEPEPEIPKAPTAAETEIEDAQCVTETVEMSWRDMIESEEIEPTPEPEPEPKTSSWASEMTWKEIMKDENKHSTEPGTSSWASIVRSFAPQEPQQNIFVTHETSDVVSTSAPTRPSRTIERPTIKVTEAPTITEEAPPTTDSEGFLECVSKKEKRCRRSRSRSQQSVQEDVPSHHQKPEKTKKNKHGKQANRDRSKDVPKEIAEVVKKEVPPQLVEELENIVVEETVVVEPQRATTPLTTGLSWAAIAAQNVPEPVQYIRPLYEESTAKPTEAVPESVVDESLKISTTIALEPEKKKKTKKPKKKNKKKHADEAELEELHEVPTESSALITESTPTAITTSDAFISQTSYWSAKLKPQLKVSVTENETKPVEELPETDNISQIPKPAEEVTVQSPTDQPTTWSALIQTETTVFPAPIVNVRESEDKVPWTTLVVSQTADFQTSKRQEVVDATTDFLVNGRVSTEKHPPVKVTGSTYADVVKTEELPAQVTTTVFEKVSEPSTTVQSVFETTTTTIKTTSTENVPQVEVSNEFIVPIVIATQEKSEKVIQPTPTDKVEEGKIESLVIEEVEEPTAVEAQEPKEKPTKEVGVIETVTVDITEGEEATLPAPHTDTSYAFEEVDFVAPSAVAPVAPTTLDLTIDFLETEKIQQPITVEAEKVYVLEAGTELVKPEAQPELVKETSQSQLDSTKIFVAASAAPTALDLTRDFLATEKSLQEKSTVLVNGSELKDVVVGAEPAKEQELTAEPQQVVEKTINTTVVVETTVVKNTEIGQNDTGELKDTKVVEAPQTVTELDEAEEHRPQPQPITGQFSKVVEVVETATFEPIIPDAVIAELETVEVPDEEKSPPAPSATSTLDFTKDFLATEKSHYEVTISIEEVQPEKDVEEPEIVKVSEAVKKPEVIEPSQPAKDFDVVKKPEPRPQPTTEDFSKVVEVVETITVEPTIPDAVIAEMVPAEVLGESTLLPAPSAPTALDLTKDFLATEKS
ncbi:titin-like, partial [Rhagoletis pomonella]|uniref:titin-like n=1 Tax=Rhagoletis pomonella TaxID=28610 RepID=UPI001782B812